MAYLTVALGGALGAAARFWVYNLLVKFDGEKFPYATLAVNVLGSFLIGLAFVLITENLQIPQHWRVFVTAGVLGAFTTFSTFSMDALGLLEQGRFVLAAVYILSSVVVCIAGAWAGLVFARNIV